MRNVVVSTLLLLTVWVGLGHARTDSTRVYFNVNQGRFDPSLGGNAATMETFIRNIQAALAANDLDHIVIRGYASPDGPLSVNERLAKSRCEAIAAYIVRRTGISREAILTQPGGIAWDELRRLVTDNQDVPKREEILEILDSTSLRIYPVGGVFNRKARLRSLAGGQPYRWMLGHLFPQLRYALALSVCRKSDSDTPQPDTDRADESPVTADTLVAAHERDTVPTVCPDSLSGSSLAGTNIPATAETEPETDGPQLPPYHLLALKTNLLYYGALLPNLELEWRCHDRWSVAVEGNVASWGRYSKLKSYRLSLIDAEVRHWIKPREPWHGLYVGLFAGGGWYDLENGGPGKYGEGALAGASLGYMWPIGRRLSLEAGVGAGYLYTRFKEYEPYEGHHLYQRTKELHYFGPLKLKFSLVWRFLDRNKLKRPGI